MTLITLSAVPKPFSVEVNNLNSAPPLCHVIIIMQARINDQYFLFPMESNWDYDTELSDGDLFDDGAMNDVLATYGYVLP